MHENRGVIRVLHLEDSSLDAKIVEHLLKRGGLHVDMMRVDTQVDFQQALADLSWDLILADYSIPDYNGLKALAYVRGLGLDLPFIIVSGNIGEELAVQAMRAGATDYVLKHNLGRLVPTVQRELRDAVNRRARHRLEELAQVTLQSITDGVIVLNLASRVELLNAAAERLTGWSRTEAQGRLFSEVMPLRDEATGQPIGNPTALGLMEVDPVHRCHTSLLVPARGPSLLIEDRVSPIHLEDGRLGGCVVIFHDVTEARHMARQLVFEASHDALTGLVNRREFEQRLGRFLGKVSPLVQGALFYMDLDQFKVVNDTCGHGAGDELLRQLAALFAGQVRERDTLARLGGDEFALLMEYCSVEQAQRVAEAFLEKLRDYSFYWNQRVFQVGVSIGVIPLDGTMRDIDQILGLADHACYAAKENGRNRFLLYREQDPHLMQRQEYMQWVPKIRDGLDHNRFQLFCQAITPLDGQAGNGYHEILLRFREHDGSLISPQTFLPAAERYDLMPAVDHWVVQATLDWLALHPERAAALELLTINLSGHTLSDPRVLEQIARLVETSSVSATKLCFEVTETAAINHLPTAIKGIQLLREFGCKFALDDFGTGVASFSYLKKLPVDILKIDGSFVEAMIESPSDLAMVRSINEVGHIMGKRTVAEFVSGRDVLMRLREIGVDFGQGYYLGKPVPLDSLASTRTGH